MAPVSVNTYYYAQLTDDEKMLYERLLSWQEGSISVTFDRVYSTDACTLCLQNAVDALRRDRPDIFWLGLGDAGTSITLEGDGQKAIVTPQVAAFITEDRTCMSEGLQNAVASVTVTGESVPEKIASVWEYLINSVSYDADASGADTAYGALVNGRANCFGMALAFQMLCEKNGIAALTVSGRYGEAGIVKHAWNLCQMPDGRFYLLDISAGVTEGTFIFLLGSDTVIKGTKSRVSHLYHPDGDLSGFGAKIFSYPDINVSAFSNS